jgi:hypothetical protein
LTAAVIIHYFTLVIIAFRPSYPLGVWSMIVRSLVGIILCQEDGDRHPIDLNGTS